MSKYEQKIEVTFRTHFYLNLESDFEDFESLEYDTLLEIALEVEKIFKQRSIETSVDWDSKEVR